jgi:squalene-associated FAD-dependent desaturase
VLGAGLAGLAAALDLAEAGVEVTLHEATGQAGGRCRSFADPVLGRPIDNGNHLILSGNGAVLSHAARLGAGHLLEVAPEAAFPFADLASGARWTLRLPASPLAALGRAARPPGATAAEALGGLAGLLLAGRSRTVAEAVGGRGALWRGFWEPLATGVLNACPAEGSAALLRAALLRTFLRGAGACRPVLAPQGLGAALVAPALARLAALGAEIRLHSRLEGIAAEGGRAAALRLSGERMALGRGEGAVLALPPAAAAAALPGLVVPGPGRAILNAHFLVPAAAAAPPIIGLVGGSAQWIFRRGDVLSVTVSAAEATPAWGLDRDRALALLWAETARALGLAQPPLAARLLRERGATFEQSPAGAARRPGPGGAGLANLALAGDWTATGLPATLEGAILSGQRAAARLLRGARPRGRPVAPG